ncbi:formylglycine-generating enzyme family protein [Nocardiopsis nanhaiensis]
MINCCCPGSELHRYYQRGVLGTTGTIPKSPGSSAQLGPSDELVRIPAGTFSMGDHWGAGYPADGETPVHDVRLESFLMGATTVTNAQFETFVEETGYRTTAELHGVSAVFYAAFQGPRSAILHQVAGVPWWLAVDGADWRHPNGPDSGIEEKPDHPVVHVSWDDAVAYCSWRGARLPSEAEWEYGARGGLERKKYAWGDQLTLEGKWNCNIWQGKFPIDNTAEDGYLTTAPGRTYQPNGYGLWQMAGNVWEWCLDWFAADYYSHSKFADPCGPSSGDYRVMRGGSYLCHNSYCNRYRVSARSYNTPDATSGNIGFRCATSDPR